MLSTDAQSARQPTSGLSEYPAGTPEELLERFGLRAFRPGQREAVVAALQGRDTLVVMPTGGGKSLCYQLPALAGQGLVVVVSPLIALMADQWRRLQDSGVHATMLASGMEEGHNHRALLDIESGETQLVLAAPERFASNAASATRLLGARLHCSWWTRPIASASGGMTSGLTICACKGPSRRLAGRP